MQAKESWFAARGNPKMKLQGSGLSSRQILQSQISPSGKNRIQINRLTIVHGRRKHHWQAMENASQVAPSKPPAPVAPMVAFYDSWPAPRQALLN
jgi:hypothetical protein